MIKTRTDLAELELLPFAIGKCREHRVAIDGGANIGNWTAQLQTKFDSVVAFEPVESTYNLFMQRYRNSLKVVAYRNALWSKSGEHKYLSTPRGRTTSTAFYVNDKEKNSRGETWTIALDDHNMSIVDLVKLDLEGAELHALMGMEETLVKCRPVLVIEAVDKQLNRCAHSVRALHAWITAHGYRLERQHMVNRVYVHE